jgi:hypothetical protein
MATDTLNIYGKLAINLMGGETAVETLKVDWASDTFKVALFTNSYTPAQDTDELYSAISANEVANGNGYTTGGNSITPSLPTYTAAGNISTFDASDPAVWTGSGAGFTFRYAVVYDTVSSVLIGWLDYGAPQLVGASETLTITFDTLGVFTASVADAA